jgi:hypothetical protein
MTGAAFIVGAMLGLFVGWIAGTWSEHRLWLDAVCGRERIWNGRKNDE